jgi:hypothetical protein
LRGSAESIESATPQSAGTPLALLLGGWLARAALVNPCVTNETRTMDTQHDSPSDAPSLAVPEDDLRDQRFERIAARAFELYEARGGEHGQDIADWLQAERQIDEDIGQFDRED